MTARGRGGQSLVFLVVLACMAGLVIYYAVVTRVAFAGAARQLLRVHFTAIPAQPSESAAIWLHNSRVVLGVAACMVLSGVVRVLSPPAPRAIERIPLWVSDAILCVWAAGLSLAAGVLIGAYGSVQLKAFWPYAPVEVTAWALLLSLYIRVRVGCCGWRQTVRCLVWVELLLAFAASLEALGGGWL